MPVAAGAATAALAGPAVARNPADTAAAPLTITNRVAARRADLNLIRPHSPLPVLPGGSDNFSTLRTTMNMGQDQAAGGCAGPRYLRENRFPAPTRPGYPGLQQPNRDRMASRVPACGRAPPLRPRPAVSGAADPRF